MRVVQFEGEEVPIHGSALTYGLYEREFTRHIEGKLVRGDIIRDVQLIESESQLTLMLRIFWALARTAKTGPFPDFESWVLAHDEALADMSDSELWTAVIGEARRAFFRKAPAGETEQTGRDEV